MQSRAGTWQLKPQEWIRWTARVYEGTRQFLVTSVMKSNISCFNKALAFSVL